MKQSRTLSAVEVALGTVVGFMVSTMLIVYALPLWGYDIPLNKAIEITAMFVFVGLVNRYLMRRLFNSIIITIVVNWVRRVFKGER